MKVFLKKIAFLSFLALGFFVTSGIASAIDFVPPPFNNKDYSAKYISQSIADPIAVVAGESQEVTVKIKNTGKATWYGTGKNFVSAYTVDPNYRNSIFYGSGWPAKDDPAKLKNTVKPGQTGEFTIKLYAPKKPGAYDEKFYLAAEDKTWIKGSYFHLIIKVTASTAVNAVSAAPVQIQTADVFSTVSDLNQAEVVVSTSSFQADGGALINYSATFENTGTTTWDSYSFKNVGLSASTTVVGLSVADSSWLSQDEIYSATKPVIAGDSLDIPFIFRAPAKAGQYIAKFQLFADGEPVAGSYFEIAITVNSDAPEGYSPSFARELINQPNIRVGLFKDKNSIKFKSDFPYNVYAGSENKGVLSEKTQAVLSYLKGTYHFKSDDLNFDSSDPIRLVPDDPNNYFSIPGYERTLASKKGTNFNVYRGTLEYRYSPKSGMPYIINELPLDLYVAGIAETSDDSAPEYIKAVLVAARSYAFSNIYPNVSTDTRMFDVYPSTIDQLYLGYNSELLMPHVVSAEKDTFGQMVTYNGAPVVTFYFSHSDGATKSWEETFGDTNRPWLQSVEAIYDTGLKMSGHGIGMSNHDASVRAAHDGWTYYQLLKYYYTGTEVEKIY